MKKIDKAVEIFLQREHQEYKTEIAYFIDALKESIIAVSCPSSYGLKNSSLCPVCGRHTCWNEEAEE